MGKELRKRFEKVDNKRKNVGKTNEKMENQKFSRKTEITKKRFKKVKKKSKEN